MSHLSACPLRSPTGSTFYALQEYLKALELQTEDPPAFNDSIHLLHSNLAAVYGKQGNWRESLSHAEVCVRCKAELLLTTTHSLLAAYCFTAHCLLLTAHY